MAQNVHPDTQNTNTDSLKRNSQTRTHRHLTYTQLDEWPADRCEAELTKEAVCSQILWDNTDKREKEVKRKMTKETVTMVTFHTSKKQGLDFRLMKSPKLECWEAESFLGASGKRGTQKLLFIELLFWKHVNKAHEAHHQLKAVACLSLTKTK